MARRVVEEGTGITARSKIVYDGTAEDSEAIKNAFRAWGSRVREAGGDYGAVALAMVNHCEQILTDSDAPEPYAVDSAEWFAMRCLVYHGLAKKRIEENQADEAARFAFNAGTLWATYVMKYAWEPEALTGKSVREAAARGGRKAGSTAARDARLASEYLRRRSQSRLSETALKASVGADHGLSRSASIDAINRGLKKVSG